LRNFTSEQMQKVRIELRNGNIDFESVMKNVKCKFVVADKGYDSRKNRYFVPRKMKASPHIPRRITSGATYLHKRTKLKLDKIFIIKEVRLRQCSV
jgi:hypothetical protein